MLHSLISPMLTMPVFFVLHLAFKSLFFHSDISKSLLVFLICQIIFPFLPDMPMSFLLFPHSISKVSSSLTTYHIKSILPFPPDQPKCILSSPPVILKTLLPFPPDIPKCLHFPHDTLKSVLPTHTPLPSTTITHTYISPTNATIIQIRTKV